MQNTTSDTLQLASDTTIGEVAVGSPPASLFIEHALPSYNHGEIVDRANLDNGLALIIVLTCLVIAVYLQRNSDNLFISVFKASFDRNLAVQDARVENSQRRRNLFLLQLVSLLTISLFITGILSKILTVSYALVPIFFVTMGVLVA
ncbi:MAG: hypothetical protein QF371_05295, partial [Flavobacteriales bacterium]|nr:hypothetical protein [Flavobacteriales bacterium]